DRGMKKTVAVAAAWLPFLALWQIFAMQAGATFARALPFSLFAIGSAAVLGLAISRFCAWLPWPREVQARFYAFHLLGAAIYTTAWTAAMFTFARIVERPAPRMLV